MGIFNPLEDYLIKYLSEYNEVDDTSGLEPRLAIRALMNITKPDEIDYEFYEKQDQYLKGLLTEVVLEKGEELVEIEPHIVLYEGDITTLKVDAVVNPTNDTLEGSYVPLDESICSAILSFAGLQVRRDCMELIKNQVEVEKAGGCKVTKGYNLPCEFIFHTVPPFVKDELKDEDKETLKKCYLSCLKRAEHCDVKTIAFPVVLDDESNFPFKTSVKIAVNTVREYFEKNKQTKLEKVIFVLSNSYEYEIYEKTITNEISDFKLVRKLK